MKYVYSILFLLITHFATAQAGRGVDLSFDQLQVKFYPNPATTFINFELVRPSDKNVSLQIFNLAGKKVFETTELAQKTTVPVNDYFRGLYIYQLRDKFGKVLSSGKFQVK